MDWLIATPVWGARCVETFISHALPAIKAAARDISGEVRFVVHTDQPFEIAEALGSFRRKLCPVPVAPSVHHTAGIANREALELARPGECVALINADMVPSREVFSAAERQFAQGRRMIMMAASRTLGGAAPIGADAAALLEWAMAHKHPTIMECFWGRGRSSIPWAIYFEHGGDIVLHGFHLHPFAVMKDRDLQFSGATIDWDLADNYRQDEIHLVTEPSEAAFAELSPPERNFPLIPHALTVADIAAWARHQATPLHRWLFSQRITIRGDGAATGDAAICDQILQAI